MFVNRNLTAFGLSVFRCYMKNKICTKCKQEKEISNFNKQKGGKDGLRSQCKQCIKDYRKTYDAEYYLLHKQKLCENKRKYNKQNADIISIKNKQRRIKYNEYYREKDKKTYLKHKYKILSRKKEYNKNNKNLINQRNNKKRKINTQFRLAENLRRRINHAIRGKIKSDRSFNLIGCSVEELKKYLENKFTNGMSWKNYGLYGWHIDHIIPCSSFDLNNPEEQKKCFHYSNLQPLWAKDNLSKGDKLNWL